MRGRGRAEYYRSDGRLAVVHSHMRIAMGKSVSLGAVGCRAVAPDLQGAGNSKFRSHRRAVRHTDLTHE